METNLADQIRNDFRNFLYLAWEHLGLPEPTKVQYEIADWLQSGEKRKVLQAFRGVGKSWITSCFVCWCLLNDPQEKFLVVSASKGRADDFSIFTKRLIREMDILQHLEPEDHQRDSRVAFDVSPAEAAHAPSVKSVGVFGQMTGARADRIIADDVEVPNNSYTQDQREKLFKRIMEFESILKPDGEITFLGTPQTEESIYSKLNERGYTTRIWPARYPNEEQIRAYEGALADTIEEEVMRDPDLVGDPTDPERFNELDLMEREQSMGKSTFALQFMLDTSLSDAEKYPLKLSDLIVFSCDPERAPQSITWTNRSDRQIEDLPNVGFSGDRMYRPLRVADTWVEYEGSLMAIDPSGRGTDETAYAVTKQLYGYVYVTEFGGIDGGYDEDTLSELAEIAREQDVNKILVEDNFGDGMFSELFKGVLKKVHPVEIEEVKHSRRKEERIIDTLEPIMNSHKLIVSLESIRDDIEETYNDVGGEQSFNYSLLYQMTRLTNEKGSIKHDDRLDALAIGVRYWTESMARDAEQAIEDYEKQQWQKEIKRFMDNANDPTGREQVIDTSDVRERGLGLR